MGKSGTFFSTQGSLTLVGAGECSAATLTDCLRLAPVCAAADGGAATALAAGVVPEAVIGDLDSLDAATRAVIPKDRLFCIPEQDSTDFDKCLARIEAPLILCPGFLGGRADHALAAFSSLVRSPRRAVLVGEHDVAFHLAGPLAMTLRAGARLSLFPMAPVTGHSEGLEWPIAGLEFAPAGRIGTSNRVTGPVRIAMDGPGMICLLERGALDEVARALSPAG